ncbi:hypothetical protein D3C76_1436250 [compost metagenome]
MLRLADPLVHADVAFGADHLDGVTDRLHGALPPGVFDIHAAQGKDSAGADFALLVSSECLVDDCAHFASGVLRPFGQALVNQGAGGLQALVKSYVVLSGLHDLVLAIERHQRDVAFLATDLGLVLLS